MRQAPKYGSRLTVDGVEMIEYENRSRSSLTGSRSSFTEARGAEEENQGYMAEEGSLVIQTVCIVILVIINTAFLILIILNLT